MEVVPGTSLKNEMTGDGGSCALDWWLCQSLEKAADVKITGPSNGKEDLEKEATKESSVVFLAGFTVFFLFCIASKE